jgi:hypothetical protein
LAAILDPSMGTCRVLGFDTVRQSSAAADNVAGRLPTFMADCGFVDVTQTRRFATPLGTIALYRARKPGQGP